MNDRIQKSVAKRMAGLMLELLLVAVIVGLIVATWLPAIIGANPDVNSPSARHLRNR